VPLVQQLVLLAVYWANKYCMAQTFIGFNTQGQFKKFTLTGFELIKRDLLNAFNIRQGQLPGRPAYGTVLWDFLFENQVEQVSTNIVNEVQRVAGGDPRIQITDVQIYPQLNGILIELELEVLPSTDAERLALFFDLEQRRASYV
jgi:phage baseplate assembly protein W